ncbi:MAG: hypothetical protein H0U52_12805 [Chloroflexi bacterium]|nr:hypothetical protein [Chloroflexota bacterium]
MKRNWLEWLILLASTGLVIGVVGYLLVSGLTSRGPAAIRTEVINAGAADSPDGGWLVPLIVRNQGGTAAGAIVVEATAMVDGTEEASQLTVDLLAADSEVELALGFSGPPDGDVEVRVVGYETP